MGKNLILKGADFSVNAISNGLPDSFDYEIIGVGYSVSEFPDRQYGNLIIYDRDGGTVGRIKADLTQEFYANLADGDIFRLSDVLFAEYSNSALHYMVNNLLYPSDYSAIAKNVGAYTYDSATGSVTYNSQQTSYRCATIPVKKGDIVVIKGVGANTIRPLVVVKSNNSVEFVSPSYTTYSLLKAYEIQNDGVAYFSNNNNSDASPIFGVFRLGEV